MPEPVLYVVGDVHLDGGANAFPDFLDYLIQRAPAHLVILGDLFEYWLETTAMAQLHDGVLSRLRRLRDAGWRLDLVLGNREFAAGRLLAARSGCRLHWPHLDLQVGVRRLRIVHGDRLCYDPGYRAFAAFMRAFFWRGWYPAFPGFVQDLVARFLRSRSKVKQRRHYERPPGTRPRVFIDRRKVQSAGRYSDTLIAGHIHQSWRRTIGGVDMILVGDWPAGRGHWLVADAGGGLHQCHWPLAP
jgi:UDP-2,3-diacylglucosamine hydrolase